MEIDRYRKSARGGGGVGSQIRIEVVKGQGAQMQFLLFQEIRVKSFKIT